MVAESLPLEAKEDHPQRSVADNAAYDQSLDTFLPPIFSYIVPSMHYKSFRSSINVTCRKGLPQSFIPFNEFETTLLPLWPTAHFECMDMVLNEIVDSVVRK